MRATQASPMTKLASQASSHSGIGFRLLTVRSRPTTGVYRAGAFDPEAAIDHTVDVGNDSISHARTRAVVLGDGFVITRVDRSGSVRKARISLRKRRILNLLTHSEPPGLMLQIELRHRVLRAERESGSAISPFDFNRSFNRTIEEYSASHLRRFTLNVRDTSVDLTVGIVARFGIWQLVEKGYVSALPASDACSVVVGKSSFCILGTLVDRARALICSSQIGQVDLVSSRHMLDAETLHEIRRVPWALYRVDDDDKLVSTTASVPVRELKSLPELAVCEDGTVQCLKHDQAISSSRGRQYPYSLMWTRK